MPRVSKFSEDQVKAMLAEAFGAACGGEGEGIGGAPAAEKFGLSYNTLLAFKRRHFPGTVKTRAKRGGGVRKVQKAAAPAASHNGASNLKGQVRSLFLKWVESQL